ncbi:MAG: hypothetical protein H7A00_08805 [Hahellaceae bacterium]|nr:hypothetical protein [Hahellaceae bacterium]
MKRSARVFSRVTLCVFMLMQIVAVNLATAADSDEADLVRNLHNARIQSYFAINAYYNFSAAQGDKALLGDINDASTEVTNILKSVHDLAAAKEYDKPLTQVSEAWKTLSNQLELNISDILKTGFPDLRLVDDMAQQNLTFNKLLEELNEKVTSDHNIIFPESVAKSRESALSLSIMMTKYSARSTSNVSQIFQGSMNDKGIDVIAKEFEASFNAVKKAATGNKDAEKLASGILTKWNFIKASYINYNENNVNYVVNLYSRRIILALVELDNLFSGINK